MSCCVCDRLTFDNKQVDKGEISNVKKKSSLFERYESRDHELTLARTRSTIARTSSESVTSRLCDHSEIIRNRFDWKMFTNYPGIKLEWAVWKWKIVGKCYVYLTAKQVIPCRGYDEKACEICKNARANLQRLPQFVYFICNFRERKGKRKIRTFAFKAV